MRRRYELGNLGLRHRRRCNEHRERHDVVDRRRADVVGCVDRPGVADSSSSGGEGGSGGGISTSNGGGSPDGGSGPGTGGSAQQGTGGSAQQGSGGDAGGVPVGDADDDGFTIEEGDCDDTRADINPNAPEICNTRDDDCDGATDEGFDVDGDGWFTCLGDCDDGNANVNPDQTEVGPNGLDDDCDGDTDGPFLDNDGDGYTEAQNDCDDDDALVNPGALEFPGNNVDDDCDGQTDEPLQSCDTGLSSSVASDYAKAIGLCNNELVSASFVSGVAAARAITTAYGSNNAPLNRPSEGAALVHLSCGRADTSTKDQGFAFDGQIAGGCTQSAHPNPISNPPGTCADADPANVCDKNELSLQIRVPTNARSFSYEFQFYSTEYPTFRCTEFDDTFLALMTGTLFNGNASFDASGNVVSVNNGFFDICNDTAGNDCTIDPVATLTGTGYYPFTGGLSSGAGATVRLTTSGVPVTPGEIITLRFIIFDEGDDQLDSSVLIDNFRWSLDPSDGPGTEPTN